MENCAPIDFLKQLKPHQFEEVKPVPLIGADARPLEVVKRIKIKEGFHYTPESNKEDITVSIMKQNKNKHYDLLLSKPTLSKTQTQIFLEENKQPRVTKLLYYPNSKPRHEALQIVPEHLEPIRSQVNLTIQPFSQARVEKTNIFSKGLILQSKIGNVVVPDVKPNYTVNKESGRKILNGPTTPLNIFNDSPEVKNIDKHEIVGFMVPVKNTTVFSNKETKPYCKQNQEKCKTILCTCTPEAKTEKRPELPTEEENLHNCLLYTSDAADE